MAFTGLASSATGYFQTGAEDVSDVVSMISAHETPLLNILGDPINPATNTWHEWLEDQLSPNMVVSSAVATSTGTMDIALRSNAGRYLMPGAILRAMPTTDQAAASEYVQITAIDANGTTITVTRGFGGSTPSAYSNGVQFIVVGDAQTDGRDVTIDISRVRSRGGNSTQIFMKDVWVSGTVEAIRHLGGIESEQDYQIQNRLREALRDLEKSVILGIGPVNSPNAGTFTGVRTFKGMLKYITTNANSSAVSFIAANTEFEAALNIQCQKTWLQGGTDIDLFICGSKVKERIDQLNSQRSRTVPQDQTYTNLVSVYEGTYGSYRVLLNRWMPANQVAMVSTKRMAVIPLQGRSFHYMPVSKTGDSAKGYVLGEYTFEFRNEVGTASLSFVDAGFLTGNLTP